MRKPTHSPHDSFDIIGDQMRPYESNLADVSAIEIEDVRFDSPFGTEQTSIPKKTLVTSLILFIVGSILIVVGCVEEYVLDDKSQGLAMLVVGSITFIPGFYYSYMFYRVYKAKSPLERQRILREIPEM